MGLDSLYCGKWRKISKSRRDLDLDRTMPQCRTRPSYFHILQYTTDRQTDGRIDRQTDRHTDEHEYSIVAVDKPQL